MKKPLLSLLFCTIIGLLFWMTSPNNSPITSHENQEDEVVSGAYEALSFWGMTQTYPSGHIPEKAQFAAWEQVQQMTTSRDNPPTEPWESMGPHNRAGRTLDLAFNPQNVNTLYACSASGGLWRSHTAGVGENAWNRVPLGFPALSVSTIDIVPNDSMTMYIGTGEVYNHIGAGTGAAFRPTRGTYGMGILKTTDGGQTWEKSLDWTLQQQKGVWMIKIVESDPNIIYAATTDGVYKSTDAGATWDLSLEVIMGTDILIHPDDPNLVLAACGNNGSPGVGIYRSIDGGENWTRITNGLPPVYNGKVQMNFAPSNPDIVFASIGNSQSGDTGASWLCRSGDFGTNWTVQNTRDYSRWQGWFSHDVDVNPNDPEDITVVGIQVWKSGDAGINLAVKSTQGVAGGSPPIGGQEGSNRFVHSDVHDVLYHPTLDNVFYVGSDGGVGRSLDNGETFETLNGRYQSVQFYNGFSNSFQDSTFSIGGLQDNGTIRWNGDLTWTFVFGGDGSWTAINPENDNIYYVSYQNLNMFRTQTGNPPQQSMGIPVLSFTTFISPYVISPTQGNILYAGSAGIAKTENGGDTWALTNNEQVLDGNPALSIDIAWDNPDVVYVGTAPTTLFGGTRGNLFVTTSGGDNWEVITDILPDRFPMDIAVDPTDEATAYVTFSGFGTGHVFRTTNYGESWEDISSNLPDIPHNAVVVDPLFPNNIYVGNDLGVFSSVDYGATWAPYMDGITDAILAFDLKISPTNRKLRVASHGNGAYQRDLLEQEITSVKEVTTTISEVSIFPNPVVQEATIQYELLKAQQVVIRLVDSAGRLVKALANETQTVGQQKVTWTKGNLSTGLYYVQVMTEDGVLSRAVKL